MKINYYEVLGVERSASEEKIRERFRMLVRENHPDRYKGPDKPSAERKLQALTEAVNILTNPAKRKQHDGELSAGISTSSADFGQVAKVYYSKGAKAFKEKDWATAYQNFDMAVKHSPDGKSFHALALAASHLPAYARQSVQAIESAVQRDPVNATYLKDAGLICKRAGMVAKAERYLDEALKWDPTNVEVQTALAEVRQARGEAKEGQKGFGLFNKKS
jgi:curved DNA-binding protein CbpA